MPRAARPDMTTATPRIAARQLETSAFAESDGALPCASLSRANALTAHHGYAQGGGTPRRHRRPCHLRRRRSRALKTTLIARSHTAASHTSIRAASTPQLGSSPCAGRSQKAIVSTATGCAPGGGIRRPRLRRRRPYRRRRRRRRLRRHQLRSVGALGLSVGHRIAARTSTRAASSATATASLCAAP